MFKVTAAPLGRQSQTVRTYQSCYIAKGAYNVCRCTPFWRCVVFAQEFEFFVENQQRLVDEHGGKVLVIKGREIIGVYDTPLQAYLEAQKEHKIGTFMIQPCRSGPEAYTVTLNSNAIYAS